MASGAYLAAFFRLADRPHLAASYHAFSAFGLVSATMALTLLFQGPLLADWVVDSPASLPRARYRTCVIEVELVVRLARDLGGSARNSSFKRGEL